MRNPSPLAPTPDARWTNRCYSFIAPLTCALEQEMNCLLSPLSSRDDPIGTDRHAPPALSPASRPIAGAARSEEHTSELQSLMRISYAVLCLKQKKISQKIQLH